MFLAYVAEAKPLRTIKHDRAIARRFHHRARNLAIAHFVQAKQQVVSLS